MINPQICMVTVEAAAAAAAAAAVAAIVAFVGGVVKFASTGPIMFMAAMLAMLVAAMFADFVVTRGQTRGFAGFFFEFRAGRHCLHLPFCRPCEQI